MKYMILDLETTIESYLGRKASPFNPDNWIVAAGWQHYEWDVPMGEYIRIPHTAVRIPGLDNVDVIVGHNIKFDLLWLYKYPEIQAFLKRGGRIWDTQYAEYLIRGMLPKYHMNSLQDVSLSYGGTGKIDAVKEYWNAGIDTPDIPEDLLMDYLIGNDEMEGDIGSTLRVLKGQLEILKDNPEQMTNIEARMEGLLATTEMEWNGLYVNNEIAEINRKELASEIKDLDSALESYLPQDAPEEFTFNWNSVYHKSALIFGGAVSYEKWTQHHDEETGNPLYCKSVEKWPLFNNEPRDPETALWDEETKLYVVLDERGMPVGQDTFKSGKRQGEGKTKNVSVDDLARPKGAIKKFALDLPCRAVPLPQWKSSLLDARGAPIYSTSADVIEELGRTSNVPFLKAMAARTSKKKDLGTYYLDTDESGNSKGMLTKVGTDGIIHHSLNHTSTVTGRMSSSNPNLQNLPRKGTSKVKQMFTSRFGDDGYIVEMDYSALEVYVQACLTRDTQMLQMLKDGVDFHCYRLSKKLGEPYEEVLKKCKDETHPQHAEYDAMRTDIKAFSFQLAYGAGAAAIADSIGMPIEEVQELIEQEHQLFPGIGKFDTAVEQSIVDTYEQGDPIYVNGMVCPVGTGYFITPTGTKYCWKEEEAPDFMKERGTFTSFSPTQRKNYPTQGEGGLVMQVMLGVVGRWMRMNDNFNGKALLINTVHDSCYMDVHKDVVHRAVPPVAAILAAVKPKFNQLWPGSIPIDFKVDAEIGKSMFKVSGYNTGTNYD